MSGILCFCLDFYYGLIQLYLCLLRVLCSIYVYIYLGVYIFMYVQNFKFYIILKKKDKN